MIKQLSPQDAQFLYLQSNSSQSHMTSVAVLDPATAPNGMVRFKDIINHVRSRLTTSSIYKRRIKRVPLELDYPYWVEDTFFDLEYHISHSRLPAPGDWRQFCIQLSRFHSRPLDMQRPPWEMYVIEGLGSISGYPEGAYAVVTKLHHCAADGAAMGVFFGALLETDALGTPAMDINSMKIDRARSPTNTNMLIRGCVNNIRSPFKLAKLAMNSAPDIIQVISKYRENQKDDKGQKIPATRFNRTTSPHKVFDANMFDLKDIRALRQLQEGSTVNDVVLAICGGALRKYLQHHRELPNEPLRAMAPINQRQGKSSLNENTEQGNNITNMIISIGTNIASPQKRLRAIFQETQDNKAAKSGLSARLMTDVSRHIPASTQVLASRFVSSSRVGRLTNVIISNVPGPQVTLYMHGAKLVRQVGLAPLGDQLGLFIAVTSYNGELCLCVTSTREIMPDINFFCGCLEDSFNKMKEASAKYLIKKSTVKKTASATSRKKPVKASIKKISKKTAKKTASATSRKKPVKASIKKISKKTAKKTASPINKQRS